MPYRQSGRECYTCKTRMLTLDKEGVQLDRCETCQQTFFDPGELAKLSPLGVSLEEQIADHSNPQLHCDECQQSILEDNDCKQPVARACPGCGEALFIVYAKPCDLEFCRKCKGIILQDKVLEHAIHQPDLITLSRVPRYSEEEILARQKAYDETKQQKTDSSSTVLGVLEVVGWFTFLA